MPEIKPPATSKYNNKNLVAYYNMDTETEVITKEQRNIGFIRGIILGLIIGILLTFAIQTYAVEMTASVEASEMRKCITKCGYEWK